MHHICAVTGNKHLYVVQKIGGEKFLPDALINFFAHFFKDGTLPNMNVVQVNIWASYCKTLIKLSLYAYILFFIC